MERVWGKKGTQGEAVWNHGFGVARRRSLKVVEEPALGGGRGVCVCVLAHAYGEVCEEVGGPWFLVVLGASQWSGCHVHCQGHGFGPGSGN